MFFDSDSLDSMSEMVKRHLPTPLRYPGGKGKVANFMKLVFLRNNLVGHEYVELYAGGASVAFSLLYEEYASHIHINDLNRSVFAFWDAVLNQTEALCALITDTPVTMEEWGKQRVVQRADDAEPLELAFSTFFLNRTNRSGIINGGVIGGKDQTGDWKIDARYNKQELIGRIQKIARHKNRITLTGLDAADYIKHNLSRLPRKTFLYLDPPYYVKGEGLYQHFYKHDNHVEIAGLVRRITRPWVVSYDAAPAILKLYEGYERYEYGLNYSAGEKYQGEEVMFLSPQLQRPLVDTPANIAPIVVRRMQQEILLF